MKKILYAMFAIATFVACSEEAPDYIFPERPEVEPQPTVTVTAKTTETTALEFVITPATAEQCAYMVVKTAEDNTVLTAATILADGVAVDAKQATTHRVESLEPGTAYNIYAAVKNIEKTSTAVIKMSTKHEEATTNPIYIWVDAAANFPDFANSKENIRRDLQLAKATGFTDVVVDVRPTNGDILFQSDNCDQVAWLGAWVGGFYKKIERTADWDYLGAFIEIGHELGLRIHAGFNTMVGGNTSSLGSQGILVRDASKKEWATTLNTKSGFKNTLDTDETTFFFNPGHPEVQEYICSLLKDLAAYPDLDGIILDRGRFDSMMSDFSETTKVAFEEYCGHEVDFNKDVMPAGYTGTITTEMPYEYKDLKVWLEFRAKTIHDFMEKARDAVRSVNQTVKFGVYVGGWYSTYYDVGVNWGSPNYDTGKKFPLWATPNYKNFGYADLMDHMLIGAYASPGSVYGAGEWTMQGFCSLAMTYTAGSCPLVCGGPDVGNWDASDRYSKEQEEQAVVNSVKACYDACNGYFLFDMIHLKKENWWGLVAQGINQLD